MHHDKRGESTDNQEETRATRSIHEIILSTGIVAVVVVVMASAAAAAARRAERKEWGGNGGGED